jgi:hypothetical protein
LANGTQVALGGGVKHVVVGVLQMAGGALEIALGAGGVATPTGVTPVGGVILIAHGADTFIAGFRSIYGGQVQQSFTQQGASAVATQLGASPQTAQYIGTGADVVAGLRSELHDHRREEVGDRQRRNRVRACRRRVPESGRTGVGP